MTQLSALFPRAVSFGATGGPNWNNTTTVTGGGFKYVNKNWPMPLWRFDVSHAARKEALFGLLYAHFLIANGTANTFPYWDGMDYKCPDYAGTGVIIDGQLYKRYSPDGGVTYLDRPIILPKLATVVGTGGSLGSIDPTTGVMTGGSATGWAGEFYVLCRYADDAMKAQILGGPTARRTLGWSGIPLEEERVLVE